MKDPFDSDQAFTIVYDVGEGEVVINDFGVKQAITVRQSMVDSAVRHAAVAELERHGYTITKPGAPLTNYEYQMLDLIRGFVRLREMMTVAEVNEMDIDDLLDLARTSIGGMP